MPTKTPTGRPKGGGARHNGRPIRRLVMPNPNAPVPLFPITPLDPASCCPHNVPIAAGSNLVCMICHQSGRDEHLRAILAQERTKEAREAREQERKRNAELWRRRFGSLTA